MGPETIVINGIMKPLYMAENRWVIEVITPTSGAIINPTCNW